MGWDCGAFRALVGYQINPDALSQIAQLAGLIASGGLIVVKDK